MFIDVLLFTTSHREVAKPCTTEVCHNNAVCHNQHNLTQQVTQHVTIDTKYHNSDAKYHNAKYNTDEDFLQRVALFAHNAFTKSGEGHIEIVEFN